jgi:hypothetical protein
MEEIVAARVATGVVTTAAVSEVVVMGVVV